MSEEQECDVRSVVRKRDAKAAGSAAPPQADAAGLRRGSTSTTSLRPGSGLQG